MNPTLTSSGVSLGMSAKTAAELMTHSPVSLREDASVAEAIACLTDRGISGVPVIDAAGRPVGVLTQTDVIVHVRERINGAAHPEDDRAIVRDIMTPALFTLRTDSPAVALIEHMRALNVHRIFLVDEHGVLTGVVTALDLLRNLELPD